MGSCAAAASAHTLGHPSGGSEGGELSVDMPKGQDRGSFLRSPSFIRQLGRTTCRSDMS